MRHLYQSTGCTSFRFDIMIFLFTISLSEWILLLLVDLQAFETIKKMKVFRFTIKINWKNSLIKIYIKILHSSYKYILFGYYTTIVFWGISFSFLSVKNFNWIKLPFIIYLHKIFTYVFFSLTFEFFFRPRRSDGSYAWTAVLFLIS